MTKLNVLILCFLDFTYISIHQHVLIMLLLSFIIAIVVNEFFLDGNFLSNFNLTKYDFGLYKKIFHEMNHPKLPNFKKQIPNHQFFCDKFQLHVAKNIEISLD